MYRSKRSADLQGKALGRDEEERKVERESALACEEEHMACLEGFRVEGSGLRVED